MRIMTNVITKLINLSPVLLLLKQSANCSTTRAVFGPLFVAVGLCALIHVILYPTLARQLAMLAVVVKFESVLPKDT